MRGAGKSRLFFVAAVCSQNIYNLGGLTFPRYKYILIAEQRTRRVRGQKRRQKMKHTEKELYAFVWRADTFEKMTVAKNWLKMNVKDNDLFDDLMCALADQWRTLSKAQFKEY